MSKMIKFEDVNINTELIDGVIMFDLYDVGLALGYARKRKVRGLDEYNVPTHSDSAPFKAEIMRVAKSNDVDSTFYRRRRFLSESNVRKFMNAANTDKCAAFGEWLTSEALPELSKPDAYTDTEQVSPFPTTENYIYCDKIYNGEYVLTSNDIAMFTNILPEDITWICHRCLKEGLDYYYLTGETLKRFKAAHPKMSSYIYRLYVYTKRGYEKFCNLYDVEMTGPAVFLGDTKVAPCFLSDADIKASLVTKKPKSTKRKSKKKNIKFNSFCGYFNDAPVITTSDISALTGVTVDKITHYAGNLLAFGVDYFRLDKDARKPFKEAHPDAHVHTNSTFYTESGLKKICKRYKIDADEVMKNIK